MPLLKQNIPLSNFSSYRIGGSASYFLEVSKPEDLVQGIKEFRDLDPEGEIFILGGGTNILFPDAGLNGLTIFNNLRGIEFDGDLLKVSSGTLVSELLNFCIENSLSGLEWAGGLPGTIGGAARGNAGAFGGEAKDNIVKVKSINLKTFEEKIREKRELDYSYRNSVFKTGEGKNEFILEVWLKLEKGNQEEIKNKIQERVDFRRERHPMELPNIGSTFKNPLVESISGELVKKYALPIKDDPFPVIPVAKLLSLAGLKGKRVGDAQISEKHPNFFVNLGHAKATDVLELIKIAREEIKSKFGLDLEEEIMILNT